MVKKSRNSESEYLEPTSEVPAMDEPAVVPETLVDTPASPAPEIPNLPEPAAPVIALRVFAAMAGVRQDQVAGFLAYAKLQALGPMTMEDWQQEVQKFNNRPV